MLDAIDWGAAPEWVGSLLAGLSLLIAAFAYRRSVTDQERSQASLVSAWLEINEEGHSVTVRNGSEAAVYDAVIRVGGPLSELVLDVVAPNSTVVRSIDIPAVGGAPPMRFRDASGRYWHRDGVGRLTGFGGPDLSMGAAKTYRKW